MNYSSKQIKQRQHIKNIWIIYERKKNSNNNDDDDDDNDDEKHNKPSDSHKQWYCFIKESQLKKAIYI